VLRRAGQAKFWQHLGAGKLPGRSKPTSLASSQDKRGINETNVRLHQAQVAGAINEIRLEIVPWTIIRISNSPPVP